MEGGKGISGSEGRKDVRERAVRTADRLGPLAEWGGRRGRRVSGACERAFRRWECDGRGLGTGCPNGRGLSPAWEKAFPEYGMGWTDNGTGFSAVRKGLSLRRRGLAQQRRGGDWVGRRAFLGLE